MPTRPGLLIGRILGFPIYLHARNRLGYQHAEQTARSALAADAFEAARAAGRAMTADAAVVEARDALRSDGRSA